MIWGSSFDLHLQPSKHRWYVSSGRSQPLGSRGSLPTSRHRPSQQPRSRPPQPPPPRQLRRSQSNPKHPNLKPARRLRPKRLRPRAHVRLRPRGLLKLGQPNDVPLRRRVLLGHVRPRRVLLRRVQLSPVLLRHVRPSPGRSIPALLTLGLLNRDRAILLPCRARAPCRAPVAPAVCRAGILAAPELRVPATILLLPVRAWACSAPAPRAPHQGRIVPSLIGQPVSGRIARRAPVAAVLRECQGPTRR